MNTECDMAHDCDCECAFCLAQARREIAERVRQRLANEARDADAAKHRVTLRFAGRTISFDDREYFETEY